MVRLGISDIFQAPLDFLLSQTRKISDMTKMSEEVLFSMPAVIPSEQLFSCWVTL